VGDVPLVPVQTKPYRDDGDYPARLKVPSRAANHGGVNLESFSQESVAKSQVRCIANQGPF
jgi:hypothetical protein